MKSKRAPKAKTGKAPKANIVYGEKDLLNDEDFEPRNVKVRTTQWFDEDVIDKAKELAEDRGMGYQTFLNQWLRETLLGEITTTRDALEQTIEKALRDFERRNKRA